ncbi:MAG: TIGR03905 family TSCPD domain-containing protein [Oscillospiraceae bacterium]|jgi:uncharacterized protein (TIGR03905 family)|nr:TIGR03905 family TSCPD domain-containing protein [Oscillospiraceae bacterium]
MKSTYTTQGTCSSRIELEVDAGVIKNVRFVGGCNGNLKAVAILVTGMNAEAAAEKLRGIRCGNRATSCADQLARAITQLTAQA